MHRQIKSPFIVSQRQLKIFAEDKSSNLRTEKRARFLQLLSLSSCAGKLLVRRWSKVRKHFFQFPECALIVRICSSYGRVFSGYRLTWWNIRKPHNQCYVWGNEWHNDVAERTFPSQPLRESSNKRDCTGYMLFQRETRVQPVFPSSLLNSCSSRKSKRTVMTKISYIVSW